MDKDTLWKSVLGEIELEVSQANYITWFRNTCLLQCDNQGVVVIGVQNIFAKNQLESKFNTLVSDILKRNKIEPSELSYKIHTPKQKSPRGDGAEEDVSRPIVLKQASRSTSSFVGDVTHRYRQGLNEKYRFENFVAGSGNELAYAACQAVAKTPGNKYNPLFIYGGVGIGKTHLIQAVGNQAVKNNPGLKVVYVTVEQFVQEFTDSIRYKKAGAFAQHYRNTDILIVDDIQFIAGKEKTQEEFFHTFNVLHQANKQVILSSDKPPHAIPTLEERLKSRFQMGMAIDMQNPDLETRCAILKLKTDQSKLDLSEDCIGFLANNFTTNIRELEGALNRLSAYCDVKGIEPSVEVAEVIFAKTASHKNVTPKQIIEKVVRYYQVKPEDVLGPKRDKDIVVPRQIAMYLLRNQLGLSYPRIAQELGRRDHTTAMHSVSKIEKELIVDPNLSQQIQEIRGVLSV